MKKSIIITCFGTLLMAGSAFAQPVHDRAVIPVAVTLEQILRIKVIDGGNVEFVFNDINDYKNGMGTLAGGAATAFYQSTLVIASSTNWQLDCGAEDATMIGTDDPANLAMALNNIGLVTTWTGGNTFGAGNQVIAGAGYANAGTANADALIQYAGPGTALLFDNGTGNGGDVNDNSFTIDWQVGINANSAGAANVGTMNGTSILSQSLPADRYVTNVLFDLTAL